MPAWRNLRMQSVEGQRTRATATAAKTRTSIATAIIAMTPDAGKCLTAAGSGADRPEVCPASGGVLPGLTPPPGSRSGVFAGSGSGGSAVIVVDAFLFGGRRRLLPVGTSRCVEELPGARVLTHRAIRDERFRRSRRLSHRIGSPPAGAGISDKLDRVRNRTALMQSGGRG